MMETLEQAIMAYDTWLDRSHWHQKRASPIGLVLM